MRRGLVFGKFMPLHRGHQLLIDRALSEVDDLSIVVWDSAPPGTYPQMPLELRLTWLRTLYPEAEAILGLPDTVPFPQSDDPAFAAHYARELEFLGRFHAVFTSEPRYQDFADNLGAEHVVVDEARELVPISGTKIREDTYAHRAWIDPRVYATLVQKVAIVGTESSGKSTLARALAERNNTLWVHEYGRELWEAQGLTGTFVQHLEIARRQYRREEAARRHARAFLFCDTTAWTTLHWSLWAYGTVDARLNALVDETMSEYVWVLCDDDFGWVQDGTREMADGKAHEFQEQQIADLEARGVDYLRVTGPVEQRAAAVEELLQARAAAAPVSPGEPALPPGRS